MRQRASVRGPPLADTLIRRRLHTHAQPPHASKASNTVKCGGPSKTVSTKKLPRQGGGCPTHAPVPSLGSTTGCLMKASACRLGLACARIAHLVQQRGNGRAGKGHVVAAVRGQAGRRAGRLVQERLDRLVRGRHQAAREPAGQPPGAGQQVRCARGKASLRSYVRLCMSCTKGAWCDTRQAGGRGGMRAYPDVAPPMA